MPLFYSMMKDITPTAQKPDLQGAVCFGPTPATSGVQTPWLARGIAVFARIDHAAGAAQAGIA